MKERTLEQHRARIQNINDAEHSIRKCFRRTRVRDYMPGQATYHLGDYPAKFSIEPTEYDFNMLKDLKENGVELIQIHEEWNDSIRRFGADKYTSHDPEGLRHFVELCHYFGLKVIAYISSGYLHVYDPDFTWDFAPYGEYFCQVGLHFRYQRNSAGSAQWRNYVLPKTVAALDKYGFDGIYNDAGTDSSYTFGEHLSKPGLGNYDPELEDLFCLIYNEVKSRGGVYKLHCDLMKPAPCLDKVYDYLWVGEGTKDIAIGAGKDYPNYVVPCPDMARWVEGSEGDFESHFIKFIPFLQFPLLMRGRHFMGTHILQDVPYYGEVRDDVEAGSLRRLLAYYKEHPNGPYAYSWWSSLGRDDEYYEIWKKYIKLYKPMVEEESVAYIEIRECDDILSPLPEKVYASMFVNEEKYLVLANFTGALYCLELQKPWEDRQTGERGKTFTVKPDTAIFLRQI